MPAEKIEGQTVTFRPVRDGIDSEVSGVMQVIENPNGFNVNASYIVSQNPPLSRVYWFDQSEIDSYLVLEENDSTKAHQSAQNFRPDVILLDIMMPKTDGGEVAAQIEADAELQRTPIIFLTALVTEPETKIGLRIQGHRSLAKPINIPELINEIEKNLRAQ